MTRITHRRIALIGLLIVSASLLALQPRVAGSGSVNPVPVTTVSSASYEATAVAPGAIVAAFGTELATTTLEAPGVPLPTTLGGTTVKVTDSAMVERTSALFFVSPQQVNYQIPPNTALGTATVTVTSGNGTVSQGTVQVQTTGSAVFTNNGDGQGVPAAYALRVKPDATQIREEITVYDAPTMRWVTKPIDLGPETDRVFLILFATGLKNAPDPNGDNNANESVRVLVSGTEYSPFYAGPQGGYVGLDQINWEIPRGLIGRGKVNVSVSVNGGTTSNPVEIEIAGAGGANPPQVTGFSQSQILAGQMLMITGQGFSTPSQNNLVRIAGSEAAIVSGNGTQISIQIPFGAATGKVSVQTPQGAGESANSLNIRTSISGLLETTARQPIAGVKMRVVGTNIEGTTGADGNFILPDVPIGVQLLEADTTTLPPNLPFPSISPKVGVKASRDNPLSAPLQIQPATGPSLNIGSGSGGKQPSTGSTEIRRKQTPNLLQAAIETGGVKFEVPDNLTAVFPDGSTSGELVLTLLENSRTPIALPWGVFSSSIVQITPFGVKLTPGGKLTFPNNDGLPAGSKASLYTLDQSKRSPTFGSFIIIGTAMVSADGKTIETEPDAIKETSYFFVTIPRTTTTAIGRVVDSDGVTPVRRALVRSRGQETFTDGDGGFTLRNISIKGEGDKISIEASLLRPTSRVDRVIRNDIPVVVNGVTKVSPPLVLPGANSNRPPTIIAATRLTVTEGQTLDAGLTISDPDPNQTVTVTVAGAPFASIVTGRVTSHILRLAPGAGTAGNYNLVVTAQDSAGGKTEQQISLTVFANRAPSIRVPTGFSIIAGQQVSFLITASDPDVGQSLILRASGLPQGATFTQLTSSTGGTPTSASLSSAATGRFTWTPAATQSGLFTINFTATDNGLTPLNATQSATVNVTALPQWMLTSGPTGGVIPALLSDGTALFVGTYSTGIWRTLDGGAKWENVLQACEIKALAQIGTAVFAGSFDCGVLRSTDQGKTWTPVNKGIAGPTIVSLTAIGSELWAGTFATGLYRSTDNGDNWTSVNKGLTGRIVTTMTIRGKDLFAGTDKGVYRYVEAEQTWVLFGKGLDRDVNDLLSYNDVLFAASNGVYRYDDRAGDWQPVNAGLEILDVRALLDTRTGIYAATWNGVFFSSDLGGKWAQVTQNSKLDTLILSLAFHQGSLLAGTNGFGLFRLGDLWGPLNTGLISQYVYALHFHGTELFAGTTGGVFRTNDDGKSWLAINNNLTSKDVTSFLSQGTTLLAGTNSGGVFRYLGEREGWAQSSQGLTSGNITALLAAGNRSLAGTFDRGLFKSDNGGQSWAPVSKGPANQRIESLAILGNTLFAGTGAGIFRSTDNGESWTPINAGLGITPPIIEAIAVKEKLLFIGAFEGVFRSSDQGDTWEKVNNGLGNTFVRALAVNGQVLYAGTENGGVFISIDDGKTWVEGNGGLTNRKVRSFAVGPKAVFLGSGGGVFVY